MTEQIAINKKKYPVRLGYYALKHTSIEVKEKIGKELNMDNMMEGGIEILEPLLYFSLISGAKAEKEELDIEREDMEFILDECMQEFMDMLPKFFPQGGAEAKKQMAVPKPVKKKK